MKKISSKFWKIITRIACAMFIVLSCAFCFVGCDTSGGDWDDSGSGSGGSSSVIDWQSFTGIKMLYTANPNRPDATKTLEANKLISLFEGVAEEVLYKIAVEYGLGFGVSNYNDYYNVGTKIIAVGEGAPEWTLSSGTVYTKSDVTGTDSTTLYAIKTGFAYGDINLPAQIGTQKDIANWTGFASTSTDGLTATDFINGFVEGNKNTLVAEMLNQNLGLSGTGSALTGASSESAMLNAAKSFTYYGLKENGIKALSERITSLVNTTEATETEKDEDFVKLVERTVYTLNEGQTASATVPATIVKVGNSYYTFNEETFAYTAITISDETVYTAGERSAYYYVFDVNHDGLINGNAVTLENVKSAKSVSLGYKNIANFVAKTFDEAISNNLSSALGGATYFYNIYVQDYSNLFLFMQDKFIVNDEVPYIPEENYVGMIYMFSDSFGTKYAESILMSFESESTAYDLKDFQINYNVYFSPKGTEAVTIPSRTGNADVTGGQVVLWDELGDFEVKTSGAFNNQTASGEPDVANGNPNALKILDGTTGLFNPAILAHMKQVTIGEGEEAKSEWQWVDETNDVLSFMFEATVAEGGSVSAVPNDLTFKIGNIVGIFFNDTIPDYSGGSN